MEVNKPTAALPGATALIPLWLQQARDQAVVFLDPQGRITAWLAGAEAVLGYPADEVLGRPIDLIFTDEDRAKGYPGWELKVAADDRYAEDSRWHLRRDRSRVWVSGSVSAVRDAHGAVVGFVKTMRDLTDQRSQLERFENEVSQLGDARSKTHTFLNTLGHELRNPLSVLSNVETILSRLVTDERAAKTLGQLATQVGVLKRLADDLMDVSRLELGKMQLDARSIDLGELLQSAVASVQDRAEHKAIKVDVLLPPVPLMVTADRQRMQQVVVNLLNNAIKYTPQGGSVWVKAGEEGNEVVCRVQDTGIGIYPPVLPRIFDLFSQASEGQEMREGGIGVGLALVRQIVELHGGTVQAKSAGIGKGAEFSFRLPLAGQPGPTIHGG